MQMGETNTNTFHFCLDGHWSSGFSGWSLPECTSVCFPSEWLLYPAALCFMVFAQWHVLSANQEVLAQVLCKLTGLQHTASFIMEISLSHHQQKASVQSREKVPNFLFTSYLWYTTGRVETSGHDTIILDFFLCSGYSYTKSVLIFCFFFASHNYICSFFRVWIWAKIKHLNECLTVYLVWIVINLLFHKNLCMCMYVRMYVCVCLSVRS